jgi:hypothetical protein
MAGLALGWILTNAAKGQAAAGVQSIHFQTVPISSAIENLSRLAGINYIIDPKLFVAADGRYMPEPVITLNWQNYTAADALARILKENQLVMSTNAFTTVVRITGTNTVAHPVDAKLLGDDTNGIIPTISFSDVPLNAALTSLIGMAHINAVLDPQLSGNAPPQPPDYKLVMMPMMSLRWHDLTARQALVEICEVYGLVLVKGPTPDSVVIKYGK